MIIVDNVLISRDLLTHCFCCDLSRCKGMCCIEGDAGAPLEEEEVGIIENNLEKILPYMTEQGRQVVKENGTFDYDMEGQLVTPLIEDKACAFICYDHGIAQCAIEKAFFDKKITFRKPISCELYPIRLEKLQYYDSLKYHQWDICEAARRCGQEKKITVFEFLEAPLTRKYGKKWFQKAKKLIPPDNFSR